MKTIMTTDSGVWKEIEDEKDAQECADRGKTTIAAYYRFIKENGSPEGLRWLFLQSLDGKAFVSMAAWEDGYGPGPDDGSWRISPTSHTIGFMNATVDEFEGEILEVVKRLSLTYVPNHQGRVKYSDACLSL